jgi:Na+-transporting methylmalonyl-CoA/oxaloacetate decarboxylase gamma subunit
MPPRLPLRTSRATARWLLLCLVCAVAVSGMSGVVRELLGSRHVHAPALSAVAAPMAGWHDVRRVVMAAVHAEAAPRHSHGSFERHHHAPGDASVVALDEPASSEEGAGGNTAGAATPMPPAALSLLVAGPVAAAACWPVLAETMHPSCDPRRLERPPST